MVDITTWFQLGTVGMVVGTVAMVWAMRDVPREKYRESFLLIAVGGIAAVAYAMMAVGIGAIETVSGDTLYLVRYIDWLLTTPLNVVYLGLIAGVSRRCLGELTVMQAATILLGLAGAYMSAPISWVLFLAGSLAFARVLQLLYGRVTDAVRDNDDTDTGLHRKLLNFIAVLWLIYPVIWVLGGSGIGLLDIETQTMVVAYIDVVAKIGFGLIALNGQAVAATIERQLSATDDTDGPATAD